MSGRIPATRHDDSGEPSRAPTGPSRGGPSNDKSRGDRRAGQGLVEYGLILAGIAAVAVVALVFFGDQVAFVIDAIGTAIDRAGT